MLSPLDVWFVIDEGFVRETPNDVLESGKANGRRCNLPFEALGVCEANAENLDAVADDEDR